MTGPVGGVSLVASVVIYASLVSGAGVVHLRYGFRSLVGIHAEGSKLVEQGPIILVVL